MSQDRFKAVKIVMQRAQIGCPVSANKTTLFKDCVTGRKVFANEFQNRGDRTITSVSVRIMCFDQDVKLVGTIKNYEYKDLAVAPGETFGEMKFIACPSESIESFAVVVTNIEMEDDYYWSETTKKVDKHYKEPEIIVEMAPDVNIDEMTGVLPQNDQPAEPISESDMHIEVEESLFEDSVYPLSENYKTADASVGAYSTSASAYSASASTYTASPSAYSTLHEGQAADVKDEVKSVAADTEKSAADTDKDNATADVEKKTADSDNNATVNTDNNATVNTDNNAIVNTDKKVTADADKKPENTADVQNENGDGEKLKPAPKPKNKKLIRTVITAAVIALVAVLLVGGYIAYSKYKKYSEYNRGAAYMAGGNYDYAVTVYTRLGNYKDSANLLNEAKIAAAQALADSGEYEQAIASFSVLGGQEDKIAKCYNNWVLKLCDEGNYEQALNISQMEGVDVSDDIIQKAYYEQGKLCLEYKQYELAVDYLVNAGNYEDAATLLTQARYDFAVMYVSVGNYDDALELFNQTTGYKDSADKIIEVKYLIGNRYLTNGEYEKALEYFENITDYEDVETLIPKCYYEKAQVYYTRKEYQDALEYYKLAGEYEDAEDKYNDSLYQYLLIAIKDEVTSDTMELFDELPKNYEDSSTIIKTLNKYVDHVGEYKWTSSNDKDVNEAGGFDDNIVVKLSYSDGEVNFTVDGNPVDLKKFAYDSGTSSDTYTMLNTTTITRTMNGKVHYYKKIVD